MKKSSAFFLLATLPLLVSAANASECAGIRSEKGQDAYEECLLSKEEEQTADSIQKYSDSLSRSRDSISRYYKRRRTEIEDEKQYRDRDFELKEDDANRDIRYARDDGVSEDRIRLMEAKLRILQNKRRVTQEYFDRRLDLLNTKEEKETRELDLSAAEEAKQAWGNALQRAGVHE
ncbi:MAG: hypothetical protein V1926_06090 [Candidatus Peregrinibacteria bacterium]